MQSLVELCTESILANDNVTADATIIPLVKERLFDILDPAEQIKYLDEYRLLHNNGQIYISHQYRNGKKHGLYRVYDRNGTITANFVYHNDKLHGKCERFHRNGNISSRATYIHGALSGEFTSWFENGLLSMRCEYVNGLRNGQLIQWHNSGHVSVICDYINGEQITELILRAPCQKATIENRNQVQSSIYSDFSTDLPNYNWNDLL